MAWTERNLLRTIGYVLIILGILLTFFAVIRPFIPTQYHSCPSPGCVYNAPLTGSSLFLGVSLIIIGIILVVAARRMEPNQERDI